MHREDGGLEFTAENITFSPIKHFSKQTKHRIIIYLLCSEAVFLLAEI